MKSKPRRFERRCLAQRHSGEAAERWRFAGKEPVHGPVEGILRPQEHGHGHCKKSANLFAKGHRLGAAAAGGRRERLFCVDVLICSFYQIEETSFFGAERALFQVKEADRPGHTRNNVLTGVTE